MVDTTKPDSRQIKKRQALPKLGTAALASVESILDKVNIEVDSPLRLAASTTPDALLNFTASLISAADNAKKVVSPVKKQIFSALTTSTINFQTQALSNAAYFDITWPTPNVVGRFRYAAFTLIGSGKIKVLFSAEATSEALLPNPGALFVSGGLPIGYVALECTNTLGYFKTAASATNVIESAKIYRLAAGGGSSSSSGSASGGGGELVDLLYNIDYRDSFVNIPDGTTTVDISAGFTDSSLHDVANELFRISYDASKTITAVGTAVTISSAPTFTVKVGDLIIVPNTDSPKKITAVASQTSVTVESAWTVNPTAAACNISQAVHTQDLNAFTAGGTGLAASSQYSGLIDEIMVGYEDTTTAGDIIPDFGTAPVIAFAASSDNTNWTSPLARVTSLSQQELAATLPTSSTQMRLRFFSNATSGSGSVNLLGYKVFFQKQTGSTVGSSLLTAFARPTTGLYQNVTHSVVGGKSRFTFTTWGYPRGLNAGEASGSALEVYANGQRVPRFVSGITPTTEAFFTEDSGSVITMDTDYSLAGIDFQFMVKNQVVDSNTNNTTQISNYGDILDQQLDAQVTPTYITAINGIPSATQFRSDITGRASIIDLSNALAVQMGLQRLMTQDIYQIYNETGPIGQVVYGTPSDRFNQIRFVGSWTLSSGTVGSGVQTAAVGDYIEVIFYGTGLNILGRFVNSSMDIRVTIDGGTESASIIPATLSNALDGRNYAINTPLNVASGLTLGLHTVKIRNNTTTFSFACYGVDVLTETTSLRATPGAVLKGRYKNINPTLQSISYNSGFETGTLGTKGGRVVIYTKTDGTIAKVVTPTNTAIATLTATDHTNEEVIRKFNWREFGANRSDDFSTLNGSVGAVRAFTLDDNITTLVCSGAGQAVYGGYDAVVLNQNPSFVTLTFVGTGLDMIQADGGNGGTDTYNIQIDGGATLALPSAGSTIAKVVKLCSGLPYGTHTVKINRVTASIWAMGIIEFLVYGPKKPIIPVSAIEIGEYNVLANFVANTTAGLETISTGVIRKQNSREFAYINGAGAWGISSTPNTTTYFAFGMDASGASNKIRYAFFGTGVDLRFLGATNNGTMNVTLNGLVANTTNFPTIATATTGSGASFNTATGVLTETTSGAISGVGVSISGLPLNHYVIDITAVSGVFRLESIDVICPIYSNNSMIPQDAQNTLTLGNTLISDLRKFNKRDSAVVVRSNISQAKGVTASPTTTSTSNIPMPDMSVTHLNASGRIKISFSSNIRNSTSGQAIIGIPYVNGVQAGPEFPTNAPGANVNTTLTFVVSVNVSVGINKIDIYWRTDGGTLTAAGIARNLLVEEA